jgi:hypothetical protein
MRVALKPSIPDFALLNPGYACWLFLPVIYNPLPWFFMFYCKAWNSGSSKRFPDFANSSANA